MKAPLRRDRVGEIRPSQLLFTYGVGAIVDLPSLSVLVMGCDYWDTRQMKELGEERLLAAVQEHLGGQVERLYLPPMPERRDSDVVDPFDRSYTIGVPVLPFPRWMRCPYCSLLAPLETGLFELVTAPYHPDRARYVHQNCAKPGARPTALPVRFLVACEHGHLDDFPWVEFVHIDRAICGSPILKLSEYGVSGNASDVIVSCSCNCRQPMSRAFGSEGEQVLPKCRGRRPQLRDYQEDGCDARMKAILLGASNSWFPVNLSALSIPSASTRLEQLVEEHWPVLEKAVMREVLEAFRQIGQLRAFSEYSIDEIWKAMEAGRTSPGLRGSGRHKSLKEPEWEAFSAPDAALNSTDFWLTPVDSPRGYERVIERVVLVERLRQVRSLLGFTRLASPGDYTDVGEIPEDARAPLTRRPPRWVPATEVRGEGIFLQFNERIVSEWCKQKAVRDRELEFLQAHRQWRRLRGIDQPDAGFQGIRYLLLHSFSHALMRQFALECGYTAASLGERIYSLNPIEAEPMAGILIYTAASDSEGTLGGLVSLGEPQRLARHIEQALEAMRLCASDPLCAEHQPHTDHITLHGGACHACLFAPETSCETGNRYLDRNLLVPTLGPSCGALFP